MDEIFAKSEQKFLDGKWGISFPLPFDGQKSEFVLTEKGGIPLDERGCLVKNWTEQRYWKGGDIMISV